MTDTAPNPAKGVAGKSPAARQRNARVVLVKQLRRVLPAAAVALLLACAAQVALRGFSAPPTAADSGQASRMLNPQFSGKSKDGRSYSLSGREGMADPQATGLILIDQPSLILTTKDRKVTKMTSRTGVYDEKANTLLLKGDVSVDDGAGSRFSSQQAVIDTRTGAVSGQKGLVADSASGRLQAQDYTVLNEGDRLILRGGVRGRLNPQN